MSKLNPNFQAPDTKTENGALAFSTTGSKIVDFFARFGAMRNSSQQEILDTFDTAFAFEPVNTLKLFLFFRDCRGGQGERNTFRVVYHRWIQEDNKLAYRLLPYVPFFGYWKEVRELMAYAQSIGNASFLAFAANVFTSQIATDMNEKNISLCAKYAPTENWSKKNPNNKRTFQAYMRQVYKSLPVENLQQYRQLIASLRSELELVESQMSAKEWENIVFERVPSKAHKLYRKAFGKHQTARYAEYLERVEKGASKINAAVLTPVDVVGSYLGKGFDQTLELQWKALPNLVNDDVLAICDTSGSMMGRPMTISIALGIYLAQRATGVCKNELVTFSEKPTFFDISGYKNLRQTIDAVLQMDWGMNTDLVKTFDLLLKTAKQNNATDKDMPKYILIISDLQFDRCTNANRTPFEEIKRKFAAQGLTMPKIVFWQVNATNHKAFPVPDEFGTIQISGESPAVLNFVLGVLNNNSMQVIENILNNPRYAFVDSLEVWGSE